jgi:serine/threonine protein kinase/tetratricopeptide (TPR) repeat protein
MQTRDEAAIFNEARRIDRPELRRAYLAEACCGDQVLKARLELLLRAHDEGHGFLQKPADGMASVTALEIREGPGACVGPYQLQEQLGEGGFGIVYLAKQLQPVRRQVALKVLKPGMDTRQVVARFEAERQALALMGHPNIAQVLDGGETAAGRPYFVMELVRGVPITTYCDRHHLSLSERLQLLIHVCQAVQHAHQKGVIHRDLKPSNVLVALHDGAPVVKVIDFGIAKAVGTRLTDNSLETNAAQIIGTPLYMSPEQAELGRADVDTRSDVYSLGVLLYELLTGTTPFEEARLSQATFDELRRIIREEEPARPSTRISALGDTAPNVFANRQCDPRRLRRLLRGELDWIIMRCLEKDRVRRYQTAAALSQDVERYLNKEPVEAGPPTAGYRLRKLAARHRRPLAVLAAFLLLLVAGTAVSVWQAVEATQAKHTAEGKEAETRAVFEFVQKHVFAAARPEGEPGGLGHDVPLRRALKAALAAVDQSFADQPLVEARVRRTLGESFLHLGEADVAAEQFARARSVQADRLGPVHVETLHTANNLALSYRGLGRLVEARDLFEETLAARTATLGSDHLDTLQSMQNLATVFADLGHYAESFALREKLLAVRKARFGLDDYETIRAMTNLANSYSEAGRAEDALRLDAEALGLLEAKFGLDHLRTLSCRNNLALDYATVGRHEDALTLQEGTLVLFRAKFGPEHPATLQSMHNVAKAHADLHQYEAAVQLLETTLALQQAKLGPDHPDTIQTVYSLANHCGSLHRYADALDLHQEAFALRIAKLGPDHRDTLYSMWGVASNLLELHRGAEAVPIIDECLRRATGDAADPSFSGLADKRLRYFQDARDPDGCRTTAELWEKFPLKDPTSFYNAARYRAVAAAVLRETDRSPEAAKNADAEADRAMAWLSRAVAAGYRKVTKLERDKDLDALRGRADFRSLVAEAETGQGRAKTLGLVE